MPAIETKLWMAINAHVDDMVVNPSMPIIDPGDVYKPSGEPFILLSDVRNETVRRGIDASLHEYSGTLMLQVRWPIQLPISHTQLLEIAGTIADHFHADTMMQFGGVCARVTSEPTVLQPDVDGAYRFVIVRVPWSTV